LGEDDEERTQTYMDPRNRSLNKQLLSYHRTHDFRSNGIWQLPFGPGQKWLNSSSSWMARLVERWQLGAIFSLASGAPLTVNAPVSTLTQATALSTPNIVGEFPKSIGKVTKLSNGVTYFSGLQQVDDPAGKSVTTQQTLQNFFSEKAIADS